LHANIKQHVAVMQAAARHGVLLLVFPELSLTGYEPSLARKLAVQADDTLLQPIRDQAAISGMTAVVGMPLSLPGRPGCVFIGALVLKPNDDVCVYTKQHLAPNEASVFEVGMGGAHAQVADQQVALAICYDTAHASHPAAAADAGASIYAAGIWSTPEEADMIKCRFEGHALQHHLTIVVANYGGPTGGASSGGGSAIWSADGTLVVKAPESGVSLVVATDIGHQWSGSVIHDIPLS
jgi:predicted amidohydrolase